MQLALAMKDFHEYNIYSISVAECLVSLSPSSMQMHYTNTRRDTYHTHTHTTERGREHHHQQKQHCVLLSQTVFGNPVAGTLNGI